MNVVRRLRPLCLALAILTMTAPVLRALPMFWVTVGDFEWKDLDGRCVASCPHGYTCPCQPVTLLNYWMP